MTPNKVDNTDTVLQGRTALHAAAGAGHSKVVRLLLLAGSNVEAKDHVSFTESPLHLVEESRMNNISAITSCIQSQIAYRKTRMLYIVVWRKAT